MKTLFLLRHAKSDREAGIEDFDRPLARRGREAAARMGAYMRTHNLRPDLILCSSAKRASETAALVLKELGPVPIERRRTLYLASAASLLRETRQAEDAVKALMLVGHDPGMHSLAVALAGDGDADVLANLRAKLPTGALVQLQFEEASWRDVAEGEGLLKAFIRPRDLDAE
jgi:phosphohistidine phosphatase